MPNVIHLRGDRVYDEAKAASGVTTGQLLPGMLLQQEADDVQGFPRVKAHSVPNGRHNFMVAIEDSLRGMTCRGELQQSTQVGYVAGEIVRYQFYQRGSNDSAQMLLHAGENVAKNDWLVSYGDGTLCKVASNVLANIAAASTTITNTNTETTFSNGSVSIPANTLKVGSVIRVRAHGVAPSTNSTDTLTIKLKIGTTVLVASAAIDVANDDTFVVDAYLIVRTIGATGTLVANGLIGLGVDTVGTTRVDSGSATIDTTGALTLALTATWSVASASNQVALQSFIVEHVQAGTTSSAPGDNVVCQADEAKDLSAASDPALLVVRF